MANDFQDRRNLKLVGDSVDGIVYLEPEWKLWERQSQGLWGIVPQSERVYGIDGSETFAVADRLLGALGCGKLYDVQNPFDWMELISLQGMTNFFDKRVGEYQKASIMNSITGSGGEYAFKVDEDF